MELSGPARPDGDFANPNRYGQKRYGTLVSLATLIFLSASPVDTPIIGFFLMGGCLLNKASVQIGRAITHNDYSCKLHPPVKRRANFLTKGFLLGKICTFFGHSCLSLKLEQTEYLKSLIIDLIKNHDVDTFWVSHYGDFDRITSSTVSEIQKTLYPNIQRVLVRPYVYGNSPMQKEAQEWDERYYDHIFAPLDVENGPPKFAISRRNNYMADECDYMICFVNRSYGGALKAMRRAINKGKAVYNIPELCNKDEQNY